MADPVKAELRARALSILRDGRLATTNVVVDGEGRCLAFAAVVRPPRVSNVPGHPARHVSWTPVGGWSCDCDETLPCRHVTAAQQVAPTMPSAVDVLGLGAVESVA